MFVALFPYKLEGHSLLSAFVEVVFGGKKGARRSSMVERVLMV